jgi:hypothetical protein
MKRVCVLIAVFVLVSFAASATTITYSSVLTADPDTGLLSGTLSVPQFNAPNPSYQLTAVNVTFTLGWSNGTASIVNNGGAATHFNIDDELSGTLTGGPTSDLSFDEILVDLTNVAIGAHSTVNYPTTGTFNGTDVRSTNVLSPFTGFVGAGNVVYTVDGVNDFNAGCTGLGTQHCAENGTVDFEGTLDVTYTYNTPEPATMAFAGFGLLALGFLGRRFAARRR